MKTDQEKIEVMQAHLRGEKIEVCKHKHPYVQCPNPMWDWLASDYRVAPRVPRRVWLVNVPAIGEVTYAYASKSAIIANNRAIEFVEVLP